MTDIAALFDDALFPLELTHPVTKEPVGITFYLAPHEADATVDWWVRTTAQVERMRAGTKEVSSDRMAEIDATAIIKRCAAATRRWEWNGKSFGALGVDPACTMENKLAVLNDPGASWIVDQVFIGGAQAENFTRKPDAT